MTPRERVRRLLDYQKPDRTPTKWGARAEVNRAVVSYLGTDSLEEALKVLGIEGWGGVGLRMAFPDFDERATGTIEGDFPMGGTRMIVHDERTFEDEWGVVRRVGSDGKYVQWVTGPLADATSPDEYDFPGSDRIVDDPSLAERVQQQKGQGLWVSGSVGQPYRRAWELRGLENLLADYAGDPGFVEALYDRIYPPLEEIGTRLTQAGIDEFHIGGDIAMHDRVFAGPERWRAIDKPRLARLIAGCKAINPDLVISMHSDGNLFSIMDDLIEIGFQIIDPIQPECMDPVEVKKRYGDRITLQGCGSLQKTLPFGTPEGCRQEVRDLIRNCGYNGGLILRVSNAIGFDVPVENVVAWFEEARDFDLSSL